MIKKCKIRNSSNLFPSVFINNTYPIVVRPYCKRHSIVYKQQTYIKRTPGRLPDLFFVKLIKFEFYVIFVQIWYLTAGLSRTKGFVVSTQNCILSFQLKSNSASLFSRAHIRARAIPVSYIQMWIATGKLEIRKMYVSLHYTYTYRVRSSNTWRIACLACFTGT